MAFFRLRCDHTTTTATATVSLSLARNNRTLTAAMPELTIHLTVTGADGAPRMPMTISDSVTAADLRQQASETTKIPLSSLKLIFRGRLIGDDATKKAVEEFKLEEGSVVHCMGKPASAAAASPAPTAAKLSSTTSTTPAAVPTQPTLNFMPPAAAAPVAATPAANPLQAALRQIRAATSPTDYVTAVSTLEKILTNIISHPMEEKYRRVKKQNAAFQRRLGGKPGGDAAMLAAGFVAQMDEGEPIYMMQASAEAWPKLMATKAAVEAAVREAQNATNTATAPPVLPGMPGMGGGSMADMQRATDFMSNPQQLQAMLQVR